MCALCDWNAELHVPRDNRADGVFLELAQQFTPVLATEGWMIQSTATMAAVPTQVHRASWVALRFTATQRQKLSWMPGWNHGLPGHGLTLRHSKDVPMAVKMLGPLVVGIGDIVFLHIPHLSLYDARVQTYGCKGIFRARCESISLHP